MNAKDLIRDWIAYAKANGISAAGNSGRSPTVGDVTEFMKNKGFDEAVLTGILDQIDTAPVNDTTGPEPDSDDSDDQEDAWWDQESGPNAYDPDYQDDTDYDPVDNMSDEGEQATDDGSVSDDGVDQPNTDTGADVGSVRDMEDESDADTVDQETKQQELMSAKRIIKKLSKAQQRQLYRELNNV